MKAIRSHKTTGTTGVRKTFLFRETDALKKSGSIDWWRLNLILNEAFEKTEEYKSRAEEGEEPSGYIYFSRDESRHLGGKNYPRLFKILEDAGILVSANYKNYKNKNQNIRAYHFLTISPVSPKYPISSRNVSRSLDCYTEATKKGYPPVVANKVIPYFSKLKIEMTEEQFFSAVSNHYEDYWKSCISKKRIPLPKNKYIEERIPLLYEIMAFNEARENEVYGFIKVDTFAGRVHSIITRLPKYIRERGVIKYKGMPLAELDIKTFQPLLFALMLEGTDFSKWFFSHRDCYEELREWFKLSSRDNAKEYMYRWMYGQVTSKMHKEFCEKFPEAGAILTRIKTEKNPDNKRSYKNSQYNKPQRNFHSNAAFIMQRLEVEKMMHVWSALGKKQIPFATIHDAVLVPEDRLDEAEELMYEVLNKHLKAANGRIRIRKTIYTRRRSAA